ncbi:SWI/SNF complex 60 kDa subunit [Hysterangium stoloniferum]|nr:SWI/SNF complex 60 kDa subunit [Hysterangium stoloniferum]
MEAPKVAKRRKLTDKTLPASLVNEFEDANMYTKLLDVERKLDWTMGRKKMEIQDSYAKISVVQRTLRVFLSHTVDKALPAEGSATDPASFDFATGQGIPSWTLKIQGRLLDASSTSPYAASAPVRKFTSFLKGIVVEFDRDPSNYTDSNIVEWRSGGHPDQDGFEIQRRGDVSVMARVLLHLKRTPERYKLAEPLAEILDIKEDTHTGIITALWHYIKVNGLQDKVDRKIIRPDAKLKPIVGVDQMTFQQLPEVVKGCLQPAEPIVLSYLINLDPTAGSFNMQAFDIEIPMDDAALKARMNSVHSATDSAKQVAALDDEISIHAQSIRSSKLKLDFLKAFSSDPYSFIPQWLASQSQDLDIILGNEQGVREEDLKDSQYFTLPWVDEAVSVQEGLRITNALRAQQGLLG